MQRLITPRRITSRAEAAAESESDKALGRLVKYIPAEIISGYMLLSGIIAGASDASTKRQPAAWVLFWFGVILTPLYLWKVGKPDGVQWWHLPISTVSFVVWAYALGGPFEGVNLFGYEYEKWFAAFLAGAFNWGIALLWDPKETV